MEEAIDIAEQSQVVIYTINTNYQYIPDHYDEEGTRNLRRLADQAGGLMLTPVRTEDIGKAFATIAHELRSRYAISSDSAALFFSPVLSALGLVAGEARHP